MTQREETLKERVIDYIFDNNYSLKEISQKLGMSKTAANFWLFHGYSVPPEQELYIKRYLIKKGYWGEIKNGNKRILQKKQSMSKR